jgi:hypothetical protein
MKRSLHATAPWPAQRNAEATLRYDGRRVTLKFTGNAFST